MGERQMLKLSISNIDIRSQPRKRFDEKSIEALAQSIRENGLIHPITVSKDKNRYVLLMGERRLRACRDFLRWTEIDAILVDELDTEALLKTQLIENVQREDLSPSDSCVALTELFTKELSIKEDRLLGFISTCQMLESMEKSLLNARSKTVYDKLQDRIKQYNSNKYEKLIHLCKTIGISVHKSYKILSLTKIIPEIRDELIFDHQAHFTTRKGIFTITIAPYLLNLTPQSQREVYAYAKSGRKTYNNIKDFARDKRIYEKRQAVIEKYSHIKPNIRSKRVIAEAESSGVKAVHEDYQFEYEFPIKFKELSFSLFLTTRQIEELSSWSTGDKYPMRLKIKKCEMVGDKK